MSKRLACKTLGWACVALGIAACTPIGRQVLPAERTAGTSGSKTDSNSAADGGTGDAASGGDRSSDPKGQGSGGKGSNSTDRSGSSGDGSDSEDSRSSGAGGASGSTAGSSQAGSSGSNGSDMNMSSPEAGTGAATDPGCPTGQLMCDGVCVPNDSRNCGTCGHDCTALPNVTGSVSCSAGNCVLSAASCAKGWAPCSNDAEMGCETDITQATDCGACGTKCDASTPMCARGTCVSGCPASTPTLCGGTCADTTSDAMHCGACGMKCTTPVTHAQPVCEGGRCDIQCSDGYMACGSGCADFRTDSKNCGACGNACSGGKTCMNGSCECPSGTRDCNGQCKKDSPDSCGPSCEACQTNVANAHGTCENGRCSWACDSPLTNCNGTCLNTGSDKNNCGFCGNKCFAEESCSLGLCWCPNNQHRCNGKCVPNNSITSCGLIGCTVCSAPAGFVPTCDGLSCGTMCSTGVNCGTAGSCIDLQTDAKNCGACGKPCDAASGGARCVAGACVP